jgi:hypothetical protein
MVFTHDSLISMGQFRYVSSKGGSQHLIHVSLQQLDYSELVCSSYAGNFLQHDVHCVYPSLWAEPRLQRDGCHCCMNLSKCIGHSIC